MHSICHTLIDALNRNTSATAMIAEPAPLHVAYAIVVFEGQSQFGVAGWYGPPAFRKDVSPIARSVVRVGIVQTRPPKPDVRDHVGALPQGQKGVGQHGEHVELVVVRVAHGSLDRRQHVPTRWISQMRDAARAEPVGPSVVR